MLNINFNITLIFFNHFHCNSCWLSVEKGTIFGFVAPMLAIILVIIEVLKLLCYNNNIIIMMYFATSDRLAILMLFNIYRLMCYFLS